MLLVLLLIGLEAICGAIRHLALVTVLQLFRLSLGPPASNAGGGRRRDGICHVGIRMSSSHVS